MQHRLLAMLASHVSDLLGRIYILSFVLSIFTNVNAAYGKAFNVVDYGAIGDGKSNDTWAFEKAWTAICNAWKDTPTMVIPKGKTFLVYPITFAGPCKSSNINIKLSGVVKAPEDFRAWEATKMGEWLVFDGVSGLNITGNGLIEGNGKSWWDNSCKLNPKKGCTKLAPTALGFRSCNDVRMSRINVMRSPQTHILVLGCKNVGFSFLVIQSPGSSPNTDGIHVSDSLNVTVRSSIIGTGDDCISIGDLVSNIKVKYVNCGPGHGISIGSLGGGGNEVRVEYITVRNVAFDGTSNGARIKTWQVGEGKVQHVEFSNLTFVNVENPIIIDQYYCQVKGGCRGTKTGVHIDDVRFTHATGTTATDVAINLNCSSNVPCTNIYLEDIQLQSTTKGKPVFASCSNAYGSHKGIVEPKSCV
ncbi:polygalacturonase-like [Mangifera indica]|uniref:polygalacturonase-like n=1 Tax=Mangifera indica TaxID=29780 RepID=UPI001CFACAA3|nr:polygalacturonase-like [Mangifera indica]